MNNPFAIPPACSACHDSRKQTRRLAARKDDIIPCPYCGLLNDEEYGKFRKDAWAKHQSHPSICELDLTTEELVTFRAMRDSNPHASKTTVLTWIEGQRYDPSKDEEFLALARDKFKEWRNR